MDKKLVHDLRELMMSYHLSEIHRNFIKPNHIHIHGTCQIFFFVTQQTPKIADTYGFLSHFLCYLVIRWYIFARNVHLLLFFHSHSESCQVIFCAVLVHGSFHYLQPFSGCLIVKPRTPRYISPQMTLFYVSQMFSLMIATYIGYFNENCFRANWYIATSGDFTTWAQGWMMWNVPCVSIKTMWACQQQLVVQCWLEVHRHV